jgi:hypothetical protein
MATITLTITDETAGGKVTNEVNISFENELSTVQEIIRARVFAEVEAYDTKLPEYYRGLIQPGETEQTLNGYKMKKRRRVDAEQQYLTALDAFQKNGFFLLIDNIQAESLEQMVLINQNTSISFIKLTPLVGG